METALVSLKAAYSHENGCVPFNGLRLSKGAMDESVVSELTRLLGKERVSVAPEERERFSVDALGVYRAFHAASLLERATDVVVHPQSTEEVASMVRLAHAARVPLVPFGSGTGVMGGIAPIHGGITLDLRGLNHIWEIDRVSRTATVGSGTVLGDLVEALSREGLMLGHDPWSQPIASVGGAISTNGVGYLAARYGPMGEQVLGLQVVLPEGEVLETHAVSKPSPGPGLDHLFIGSEGIFGVITRATLRVFPTPEKRTLYALAFDSFEAGYAAIMEMYALNLVPAMVDFDEEPPPSGGTGGEVVLYLAFEGFQEEVEAAEGRALKVCYQQGAKDQGQEEAGHFWKTRHASAERYQREVLGRPASERRARGRGWRMDYLHVAIPPSRVLEYRHQCSEVLKGYGAPVREWSIWGRPEFFSFLIGEPEPAQGIPSEVMARTVDEVLALAQDMGGTMEYCHGVGLKLGHLMERELGVGMDVARRLKESLDPHHIMNPGKLGM